MKTRWKHSTALASLGLLAAGIAQADDNTNDLLNLSLAQLSNVEVTTVSRVAEKANQAAAAIYVITQDDIRRSGATSIPEALRLAPGINVAQSGSHQWAITSRGFNGLFANKLLVLIDGRSVYTPLFSGVYWDVQDTMLEDIDRIEIIRGPGATLWGANAVNGIINIITKNAADTQGGLAAVTVGTQDRGEARFRYGNKIDDNTYMRTYVKYDDRDEVRAAVTQDGSHDEWNKGQTGFRTDWSNHEGRSYTLSGEVYRGGEDMILNLPAIGAIDDREMVNGGHILGRWNEELSKESNLSVNLYYDDAKRNNFTYASNIQTLDFDMQHAWTGLERQEIVWGTGYRLVESDTTGDTFVRFFPADRSDNLFSAFVQDKIAIVPDSFFITLGSKFEHNDYTGFEYQPSARATWLLDNKQTVWGSVSRAVHTPDIATEDVQLILAPVGGGIYAGPGSNTSSDSEELIAYELGYRVQPESNLSVDVSTFYNDYNNLVIGVPSGTVIPEISSLLGVYGFSPVLPVNMGAAHSWGAEVSTKWNPKSYLELSASYSLLKLKFDQPDPFGASFAGKSPEQQVTLSSTLFLPYDLELNGTMYYVDDLKAIAIPNYTRLDLRLSWKPVENLELSLVGQNLLDPSHPEFTGFVYQGTSEIPRSVYGNVTWKF